MKINTALTNFFSEYNNPPNVGDGFISNKKIYPSYKINKDGKYKLSKKGKNLPTGFADRVSSNLKGENVAYETLIDVKGNDHFPVLARGLILQVNSISQGGNRTHKKQKRRYIRTHKQKKRRYNRTHKQKKRNYTD